MKMAMRKQFKIKSFDDFIKFIETQNVSESDLQEILSKTIGIYIFFNSHDDKRILINDLKNYWSKYKNKPLEDQALLLND